ncbi:secreted protein [methanotrophic bacterial endosymbiont of Bathymodiolus sp.]|nr:secreted protein [methanotrophic bacterial endosymbiont of Bathymodiolus sp.]
MFSIYSKRRLNLRVLFINACSGSTCICRARFTATSNKSPISSSICSWSLDSQASLTSSSSSITLS